VPESSERVTLRPITSGNRQAVEGLRVLPEQENFVDGVRSSLAEAAVKPDARPWYRGIYADEIPVGFVMLADGVRPGNADIPWRYYLWRFLIDARFQSRGYGRAALAGVVAYLRTKPDADVLVTSVVPGAGSPLDFYLSFGFRATGQMFDREQVLELPIVRAVTPAGRRPA
jgi:diamine N-acetyltransferase